MTRKYFSSTATQWILSIAAFLGSCANNSADMLRKKQEKEVDDFIFLAKHNPEEAKQMLRKGWDRSVVQKKIRSTASSEKKKIVEGYLESKAELAVSIAQKHPAIFRKRQIQRNQQKDPKKRAEEDAGLLADLIQKDPEAAKEVLKMREKHLDIQAQVVQKTNERGPEVLQIYKRQNRTLVSIIDSDPKIAADLLKLAPKAKQVFDQSRKGVQIDKNFAHDCESTLISLHKKNPTLAKQWLLAIFQASTFEVLQKCAQEVLSTDDSTTRPLLDTINTFSTITPFTSVGSSVSDQDLEMIAEKVLEKMTNDHNEQQPSVLNSPDQ